MSAFRGPLLVVLLAIAAGIQAQNCPLRWVEYQGHCYRYFTGEAEWTSAQNICKSYGANLASIHSNEENDLVYKLQGCGDNRFWIGLNDRDFEGNFVWIDGTPVTYTNWHDGEPNDSGIGGEDCVEVDGTRSDPWKWNDNSCGNEQPFVCKI
ncbi:C-type lectin domain family 19 member A-like [Ptychodera flava]|uniref:C-type lectin domain family 19 member A-like n=1 Tax=Ptychodera flava TaxID=63121 RepID=UPI00396A9EAE